MAVSLVRAPLRGADGRRLRLALICVAALLVAALAAIQFNSVRENRQLRADVQQSYERQLQLERLLSLIQDIETGQRGFALTGNPEFLQPFNRALPQVRGALATLREDESNPALLVHVDAIERLTAQKIAISKQVIARRRRGDTQGARAQIANREGKIVMDRFRAEIVFLQGAETRELSGLLRSVANSSSRGLRSIVAIELMLFALLAAVVYAYMINFRRLARVSAQARAYAKRQAAIFDAANDAMIVIDEKGCIESLNPAACSLFALKTSEAVGREIRTILDVSEAGVRRLIDAEADADAAPTHIAATRGDGTHFEAEVNTSTVAADEVRTFLLIRDATERNRIERMKNEFVSTVSHELRTPLTSIRGALALLDHVAGSNLDERPKQLLRIAKSNSERLSLLVDDILDIEKIGSGRFELDRKPIDLREIVTQSEEQNRTYAADRGVELVAKLQREPLPVMGDASRLLQALTNLISNAAKYSPEGGVVTVVAKKADGHARLSVADKGAGIPVEFRSRIFARFAQASGHDSTRAGTGLGLAITRAIVESHGGRIDYETESGKGTCFWIDLPLNDGDGA